MFRIPPFRIPGLAAASPLQPITCLVCQREFMPLKAEQIYCHKRCRDKASRLRARKRPPAYITQHDAAVHTQALATASTAPATPIDDEKAAALRLYMDQLRAEQERKGAPEPTPTPPPSQSHVEESILEKWKKE